MAFRAGSRQGLIQFPDVALKLLYAVFFGQQEIKLPVKMLYTFAQNNGLRILPQDPGFFMDQPQSELLPAAVQGNLRAIRSRRQKRPGKGGCHTK